MSHQTNHRRFSRTSFSGSVAMWRGRQPHVVQARDLSAGGVYIQTDHEVDRGSLLTLRLSLPDTRGFTVLGKVVRAQRAGSGPGRCGIAVEFVDISPRHRAAVDGYVLGDAHQALAFG